MEGKISRNFSVPDKRERHGHNVNEQIVATSVRVIDAEGAMLGVMPIEQALGMADEADLDLVEINPNSNPPVCKIIDYGKFRFSLQKKAKEARVRQKGVELKELKFRPNIDPHDLGIKLNRAVEFLKAGHKVKVTLQFRGREITHRELGERVIDNIVEGVALVGKPSAPVQREGRTMHMTLVPGAQAA